MKINVPFHKSIKDTDCGPIVLKMVAEYFGENYSLGQISKLEKQLETGLVWTLGIARAAKKIGLNVKVISKANFSHDEGLNYYLKYKGKKGMVLLEELKKEMKKLNIEIQERDLFLEDLLQLLSNKAIPIILVNWNVLKTKKGYQGHFLVLTGFDEENIYVHNPGLDKASAFMKISRKLFQEMWESKGTDKDTIIISKDQ